MVANNNCSWQDSLFMTVSMAMAVTMVMVTIVIVVATMSNMEDWMA